MLLQGLLLVNIIRLIMWKPAQRQLDWGLVGGCLVVLVMVGRKATQSIPLGKMQTFLACGVCVSIQRLLAHCLRLQLSQQNAWQMAYICISLLEKEFTTNNISCSFSFQNLQQIGQNGNLKKNISITISTFPFLNRVNDSLSNCVICTFFPPNVY